MSIEYVQPPDGFTCWHAVAIEGPYYIALEWRRGEPCPSLLAHLNDVRLARTTFARIAQQGNLDDMDGQALSIMDGLRGSRWIALWRRDSDDWSPYGYNEYMH